MTKVDYILTTDGKFHHFEVTYQQQSFARVSQTAYTLHHRNLTQHDHLFMFVLGQIAVQFEKEVLPILQPVIEMF